MHTTARSMRASDIMISKRARCGDLGEDSRYEGHYLNEKKRDGKFIWSDEYSYEGGFQTIISLDSGYADGLMGGGTRVTG